MSIDMHCHLDLYPEPFKVAAECRKRGAYVLSVTNTPKAWDGTSRLAEGCPRIRTALGLHPQLAHVRSHELELFDALLPKAKYVGEIGLDGGKDFKNHWREQLKVFRHILSGVNDAGGKIMTIHSRASAAAVLEFLPGIDGVSILHWFTGTQSQLKKAIAIGCWFSVGPSMLGTRKGCGLVAMMPKERVLTETDGPFTNRSGESIFPWDADLAIQKLACIWKCDASEAATIVDNNFRQLLTSGSLS